MAPPSARLIEASQARAHTLIAVEVLHLQRHAGPAAADTPHWGRNLLHAPDT